MATVLLFEGLGWWFIFFKRRVVKEKVIREREQLVKRVDDLREQVIQKIEDMKEEEKRKTQ